MAQPPRRPPGAPAGLKPKLPAAASSPAASPAKSRWEAEAERRLALMIVQGAEALQERAATQGVSAYLARPPVRAAPNERFLQRTLAGVASNNRRVEEAQMWAARESQLRLERRDRGQAIGEPAVEEAGSNGQRHSHGSMSGDGGGRHGGPQVREHAQHTQRGSGDRRRLDLAPAGAPDEAAGAADGDELRERGHSAAPGASPSAAPMGQEGTGPSYAPAQPRLREAQSCASSSGSSSSGDSGDSSRSRSPSGSRGSRDGRKRKRHKSKHSRRSGSSKKRKHKGKSSKKEKGSREKRR